MEELRIFLRLLIKNRYILVVIPIISTIITYFIVRNFPNEYLSKAQISTGIVDDTQKSILSISDEPKGPQISQEFSNLVEMMRTKKIMDLVSYKLIIHDLSGKKPYRPKSGLIQELKSSNIDHALDVYQDKYNKKEGLNLWNSDENGMYSVLRSMGYDNEILRDKIRINRAGDSDFINIEFTSENPELSAFVVNTLSNEFINYYSDLVKINQNKATTFLGKLLAEKKKAMDQKIDSLRDYKIRNRVLNLDEQSKQTYSQITDFNDRKQQIIEGIAAKGGALLEIDRKFEPSERGYLESTLTKANQNLMGTKTDLQELYDTYISKDFDPAYQPAIDSLRNVLSSQINLSTDQFIYNPLIAKQSLVQQKLTLEVELDLARYSMGSIEKALDDLNRQFDELVPKEADVQSMERDVEVTSREYLDILNKYSQSNMESGFSVKLNLMQTAMPGLAQPSKKMLLVILSAIISFVFCIVILFVIYFFDNSIVSAKQLANVSSAPVLGSINLLKISSIDLSKIIWKREELIAPELYFKNQLRSLRFEIDKELKDNIITINSLNPSVGKSFLVLSLAFAWKVTRKNILVIDGNFSDPNLTASSKTGDYLEDFLTGRMLLQTPADEDSIKVLGNRGGDQSLLELANHDTIRERLDWASKIFDLVIIETSAIDKSNHSKEWILFSKNIVSVFEAGQKMDESKKAYIPMLQESGSFIGWILNKV